LKKLIQKISLSNIINRLEIVNQVSSAAIYSLASLFNITKKILLSNGDILDKASYNLISFYDSSLFSSLGSIIRESIVINSLYYSVLFPIETEYSKI
jgi:hypothetical protein